MVLIVEDIHQICIERMHIVQLGEILYDLRQTIVEVLLSVLHLACVERTNTRDFVTLVNHCGRLTLCLRQHNVDEVLEKDK